MPDKDQKKDEEKPSGKSHPKKGKKRPDSAKKAKRTEFKKHVEEQKVQQGKKEQFKSFKNSLPTQDHEERYREEEEPAAEPINPFEPTAPVSSTPLGKKPLNKRSDPVDEPEVEKTPDFEKKSPENLNQAQEELGRAAEEEGADKAETGTESVDEADVIEGEAQESPVAIAPAKSDDFKSEFWDILEQAGLTKKRISVILIAIVVIVLGLLFFFLVDWDTPEEVVETEEGSTPYVFDVEPAELFPMDQWATSFITGSDFAAFESELVYYIDILQRMDNMYRTDVYALIDMSVDRRAAVNAHLEELGALIDEASNASVSIKQSMNSFDREFGSIAAIRDSSEVQFFGSIEGLQGQEAYAFLETFIDNSQTSSRIQAYYNAYEILNDTYAVYLAALTPRYQDISSNIEALIKGVRVFDVPSSDIEAIIPVAE